MKIAGMILITLFSFYLSYIYSSYEKSKITTLEEMIDFATKVKILMNSYLPETKEILSVLDEYKYINNIDKIYVNKSQLQDLLNLIGKCDSQSLLSYIDAFEENAKLSMNKYKEKYEKQHKIYLSFGIFTGILISLLII